MNVYEENDYKAILKFYIKKKNGAQSRGAYKNLADYLGVHATLISQILAGSKDFTEEQIFSVCDFLGVPKLEGEYLLILLQIERAGSVRLKQHYQEVKEKIRKESLSVANRVRKTNTLSDPEKAIFYSSWIYSAIQVLTTLDNKQVDFDFVCERFQLAPTKARSILHFLKEIQLVQEKDGVFTPGSTSTHLEKNSPFLLKHHTNWRLKAIEAAEDLSDQELMYSANFSVSRKDFAKLREEMIQVIQNFLKVVKDSPAEDVAQFNLDFFWIKK